jgi:hypothetical protein
MVIIDFSDTKKQAFVRGFSKGISAPLMVFGQFTAPSLPEIKQIIPPSLTDEEALSNDWKVIGEDFYKVIAKYGEDSHPKE